VVNLEKMVIREAQRAYTCMNLFCYTVDAVFINRILPDEMTDSYMERWKKIQKDYYRVIEESFSSSRFLTLRLFDRETIGLDSLDEFGRHMFGEENPADRMTHSIGKTI
jgi:arsenite-transporting ATPase